MALDIRQMREERQTKWNEKELEANQFKALRFSTGQKMMMNCGHS
jgi:hypothetical protein